MGPSGVVPAAAIAFDDAIFDGQCSADAQVVNTGQMLDTLREILRDGVIDDSDAPHFLSLVRHAKLEHRMNEEQMTIWTGMRAKCNEVMGLLRKYRSQVQETKRAAREAALS